MDSSPKTVGLVRNLRGYDIRATSGHRSQPRTGCDHFYRLRVDGLACPFCAHGVEKKLGVVKGVQSTMSPP